MRTARSRRRRSRLRWRARPTVTVVDRAAAFGSLGPLGGDVLSLDLPHAEAATNVVCGLGGTDVTPATLRWALDETRPGGGPGPVYAPEGV